MADIINSLSETDIRKKRLICKSKIFDKEDKMLFAVIIFGLIIISIDFFLVLKFIDIIENI